MGRGTSSPHLGSPAPGVSSLDMNTALVVAVLAAAALTVVEAGCQKLTVSPGVLTKKLKPYTRTNNKGKPVADSPCWWDLTKSNCGSCKNGGKQCGYPMHKWCQAGNSKKGCPGIPDSKYTLSTEGGPCYWDHTNMKCAICTKKTIKQCAETSASQLDRECYSTCGSAKDRTCDGNLFSCTAIPYCSEGGRCNTKSGRCECNSGYTGNGFQCFDGDCAAGNCSLVTNPAQSVEMEISTSSQYFVYAQTEL